MSSTSGDFNVPYTLQVDRAVRDTTTNEQGPEDWQSLGNFFGSDRPQAGLERVLGGQNRSEVIHKVRMWYQTFTDGVEQVLPSTKHRLLNMDTGQVLHIVAVWDPTGKKRELHLECKEDMT